ncbi:MAG: guanylate kinase [Clostridiales bacterium]
MNKEGLLVVISGPSGVGKGTVCSKLLAEQKDIVLSISHTTREPRKGEIEGKNYFFIDKEKFETNIKNEAYLEWAKVFDNYYGTPQDFIDYNINNGVDTLLEIDTQGAILVKEKYPDGIYIFLLPPSFKALKQRLEGRKTETKEKIKKRLGEFRNEVKRSPMYDYLVVNDDVEAATETIKSILRAEHHKFEHSTKYAELLMEDIEIC